MNIKRTNRPRTIGAAIVVFVLAGLAGCGFNTVATPPTYCAPNDSVCLIANGVIQKGTNTYWLGQDPSASTRVNLILYRDGTGRMRCLSGTTNYGPSDIVWHQTSINSLTIVSGFNCAGLVPDIRQINGTLVLGYFHALAGTPPTALTFTLFNGTF